MHNGICSHFKTHRSIASNFSLISKIKVHSLLRCTTTKHGYQSKRTYGKVVHKQKMDSYIVGKKINPIRYCKILNVSRNLHILG